MPNKKLKATPKSNAEEEEHVLQTEMRFNNERTCPELITHGISWSWHGTGTTSGTGTRTARARVGVVLNWNLQHVKHPESKFLLIPIKISIENLLCEGIPQRFKNQV